MKSTVQKLLGTLLVLWILAQVGCEATGYGLWLFTPRQETKVKAEYDGLADHTVAIVVYANEDVQYEFPNARLTLTTRVRAQMEEHVKKVRVIEPISVARYQDENLHWDTQDKRKIGRDLQADYVLFITLIDFGMVLPGSMDAYQGHIAAEAHLYKTAADTTDAVWETKNTIEVLYPDVPEYASTRAPLIRAETERRFADILVKNFYDHKVPKYGEEE